MASVTEKLCPGPPFLPQFLLRKGLQPQGSLLMEDLAESLGIQVHRRLFSGEAAQGRQNVSSPDPQHF